MLVFTISYWFVVIFLLKLTPYDVLIFSYVDIAWHAFKLISMCCLNPLIPKSNPSYTYHLLRPKLELLCFVVRRIKCKGILLELQFMFPYKKSECPYELRGDNLAGKHIHYLKLYCSFYILQGIIYSNREFSGQRNNKEIRKSSDQQTYIFIVLRQRRDFLKFKKRIKYIKQLFWIRIVALYIKKRF